MRAYEFILEAVSYQTTRQGSWDISVSDSPIKSPQTGNTLQYIAKAVNSRGAGTRKGEVKIAYAPTKEAALEAVNDLIFDLSRASVNPDDYHTYNVDFNVTFTNEYIDSTQRNYFKFDLKDGKPILIMASQEFYQAFGSEITDLGFTMVHNRNMTDSTPIYGMGMGINKVKQLGLVPNMRYVTDRMQYNDSDGNVVFSLEPHSRYTGSTKVRMGEPGFILAASPNSNLR